LISQLIVVYVSRFTFVLYLHFRLYDQQLNSSKLARFSYQQWRRQWQNFNSYDDNSTSDGDNPTAIRHSHVPVYTVWTPCVKKYATKLLSIFLPYVLIAFKVFHRCTRQTTWDNDVAKNFIIP